MHVQMCKSISLFCTEMLPVLYRDCMPSSTAGRMVWCTSGASTRDPMCPSVMVACNLLGSRICSHSVYLQALPCKLLKVLHEEDSCCVKEGCCCVEKDCQDTLQFLCLCMCPWCAGVDWNAVRDFVDASDSLREFAHPEGIAQPHDG